MRVPWSHCVSATKCSVTAVVPGDQGEHTAPPIRLLGATAGVRVPGHCSRCLLIRPTAAKERQLEKSGSPRVTSAAEQLAH